MTTDRIKRIEALFGEALEQPVEQRGPFLDSACGDDAELRREIESLLSADTDARTFMDQPVMEHGLACLPQDEGAAFEPNARVGTYQLLRRIGEGGMSEVYLAVRADDEYQKRVALKVIRQDLDREDMVRRFRTERQILAGLDHPNIAKLLDGGTTAAGRPYFVMDYIDGAPIDTYCDDHRLGVPERLELFRAVCAAVQYAHQNLVVHRDLKASNILVTVEGIPKLLDFGIAKLLRPDQFAAQVEYTATSMRPMTPRYASPEQIQGRVVTTTTDVYSLGVLLYKLLTGHLPYRLEGQPVSELGRLIVSQEPQRPSTAVTRVEDTETIGLDNPTPGAVSQARNTQVQQLRRQLTGDLDNILLMAIRKEPQRRYATVEQFAEDLRRFEIGLPVAARGDTLGYRTSKFVRRNWLGVAAGLAFVALLVAFSIGTALQARRIAAERDDARRERDRAERVTEFLQKIFEVSDPTDRHDITAREILERAAERVDLELADQPEDRATMMNVIGNVYRGLGLFDKALPQLSEALAIRRQLLGTEHPRVAQTLDNLGLLEGMMGRFRESEGHLKEALELNRRFIEVAPMAVVGSLNQLGVLSRLQGQFSDAEAYYTEALQILRGLGEENDVLADSINNLGALVLRMGRVPEGEAHFRDALAVRQRVLGPNHPTVGKITSNLGVALGMQGKYEECETVLRQTLELYREGLGPDHPWLIEALNNLGKLLQRTGQLDEAERHYREALDIQRRRLGEDHPKLASLMGNLGEVHIDRGDMQAAEQVIRQALDIRRKALRPGHPDIATAQASLALIMMKTDRPAEAEPLLVESRTSMQRSLPASHWQHAQVQSLLGECLARQQRFDEAEPLLVEGLERLQDQRGPQHRATRSAIQRLVEAYEAWNRPEDARRYRALLEN